MMMTLLTCLVRERGVASNGKSPRWKKQVMAVAKGRKPQRIIAAMTGPNMIFGQSFTMDIPDSLFPKEPVEPKTEN